MQTLQAGWGEDLCQPFLIRRHSSFMYSMGCDTVDLGYSLSQSGIGPGSGAKSANSVC